MDTRDFMTVLETVGIPAAFAVAAGWIVTGKHTDNS